LAKRSCSVQFRHRRHWPPADPARDSGKPQVLLPIKGLLGLHGLAGRLANPNFAGKAPPEVMAECQANLAEARAQAGAGAGAVVGVGLRFERLDRG
jgi:hypothetical protein